MGCCSSGRNKPQKEEMITNLDHLDHSNTSFEASPLDENVSRRAHDYLKIVIKEIHLTKTIDRILKKPNEVYFRLKLKDSVQETTPVEIEGLHYT